MEKLTSAEYVAAGGIKCPHCKCENVMTLNGTVRHEGTELTQEVKCSNCGERWTEVYSLTGWEPT
jgi:DNA-directed RNA polymerase subunit M/transcription elongation factor TFIIS